MERPVVKILIAILFLFVSSCQESDSKKDKELIIQELVKVNSELIALKHDINNKLVLSRADQRSKDILKKHVIDLQNILIYISSSPNDQIFLNQIIEVIKNIEKLQLPMKDKERIYPVLRTANVAVGVLSKKYNIKLKPNLNIIFSYDFNSGIRPFHVNAENDGQVWVKKETASVNPQTFASIISNQHSPNKSWLISPQFNFELLTNVQLKIRHMLAINRGKGPYNINNIREMGFKLLYSTDFTYNQMHGFCYYSDLSNISCNNKAKWNELKFDKPSGDDFHTITIDPINLTGLAGEERVTFALVINLDADMQKSLGSHFTSWSVYDFTLEGSGHLPRPVLAPAPKPEAEALFKYDFEDSKLKALQQYSSNDDPNLAWRHGEYRGDGFASISTNSGIQQDFKSQLIYANINLAELDSEELFLHINQTLKPNLETYSMWDRVKLKISNNYQSGQPPQSATWKEIDISHSKELKIGGFNNIKVNNLDISEFKAENIAISLSFSAKKEDDHLWQISHLEISNEKRRE